MERNGLGYNRLPTGPVLRCASVMSAPYRHNLRVSETKPTMTAAVLSINDDRLDLNEL